MKRHSARSICDDASAAMLAASIGMERPLFQRAPGSPLVPNYLLNQFDVASEFATYIANAKITVLSFRQMSNRLHRIAATGRSGRRIYKPGKHSADRYSSDGVNPGHLWRRCGSSLDRSVTRGWAAEYAGMLARRMGLQLASRVEIAGIPRVAWPENHGPVHVYPASGDLAFYFARAARLIAQIRRTITRRRQPIAAIAAISDYYHVLSNARPYEQINNSVFMTSVNVLLRASGNGGVSHGWIDHLAHRIGSKQFRLVFAAHLAGELPSPRSCGLLVTS